MTAKEHEQLKDALTTVLLELGEVRRAIAATTLGQREKELEAEFTRYTDQWERER